MWKHVTAREQLSLLTIQVSEGLNSVETIRAAVVQQVIYTVSEGLNSVETEMQSSYDAQFFITFQKDLIVWKRL